MFIPNLFQPFSIDELGIPFESIERSEEIKEKLISDLINKWNNVLPEGYEYFLLRKQSNGLQHIVLYNKSKKTLSLDLIRSFNNFIMPNEFFFFLVHMENRLDYSTESIDWHHKARTAICAHKTIMGTYEYTLYCEEDFTVLEIIKMNLLMMDMKRLFES